MMSRTLSSPLFACTMTLVLCMSACKSNQELTTNAEAAEVLTDKESWGEAPFAVKAAWIEEDLLWTVVQYGGGCAEHAFGLEAVGPLMKSLPPKQPLRWVHRSPGDPCRAMITDTLKADLTQFRGTPHGTTVLLLSGHEDNLLYTYH